MATDVRPTLQCDFQWALGQYGPTDMITARNKHSSRLLAALKSRKSEQCRLTANELVSDVRLDS